MRKIYRVPFALLCKAGDGQYFYLYPGVVEMVGKGG